MNHGKGSLTGAEWTVMECLWEHSPRTGREVVECLNEKMGWSRSTCLTLLRRLEAKGAVAGEEGEPKTFRPLIARDEESLQQTQSLLERAYNGSLGLMLSTMVNHKQLSKADIDELYAILKEAEEGAE
jgi:BlaI family penicillinase repressor